MKTRKGTTSRKSITSSEASLSHYEARRQSKLSSKAQKSRPIRKSLWTAKEYKVCMKAVQKHSANYKLIALAVKTRNSGQIRVHLNWLLEQMKVDKHHPDRHILRLFEKQRTVFRRNWTRKKIEVFVEAVQKHGRNYQRITKALKQRKAIQV